MKDKVRVEMVRWVDKDENLEQQLIELTQSAKDIFDFKINGTSVLFYAIEHHMNRLMVHLFELKKGDMHLYDDYALRVACQNGNLIAVKYLLDAGLNPKLHYNEALRLTITHIFNETGSGHLLPKTSPLNRYESQDYVEILKLLLKKGCNPNVLNCDPMKKAVSVGSLVAAKILFEYGADLKYDKIYCLNEAARNDDAEMCKLLISHGATIRFDDFFVVRTAVQRGCKKALRALVDSVKHDERACKRLLEIGMELRSKDLVLMINREMLDKG
ncbi:MAG: ankyrin repeat domain-containing protein [Clostridia bacterium]|nr:ankyrin repeat domain-containing protein [Clostridia bacterium]